MKNSEDCSAHMLLYHFTSFWNLGTEDCPEKGTIWRDGIKPGSPPESAEHEMRRAPGMPHECVWLTREPFPSGWFIDEDGSPLVPDVRITVRLPTADIRLVKYERWILDNLTRTAGCLLHCRPHDLLARAEDL
jgi:hypothetical protein